MIRYQSLKGNTITEYTLKEYKYYQARKTARKLKLTNKLKDL